MLQMTVVHVMTDLSCEAGEVVPLVPGCVAVVEAVLEDEVVTQLLVVAELSPPIIAQYSGPVTNHSVVLLPGPAPPRRQAS